MVDLLGMKPNWFTDILIIPFKRCLITLPPWLHNMAHQLNSLVTSTTSNISLILVDRYQYTFPPIVKHLVRPENMVEQLGWPYCSYVLVTF
jgi:hypothetical protein